MRVLPKSLIKISLPFGISQNQVRKFLEKNTDWIIRRRQELEFRTEVIPIQFIDGQRLPFYGEELVLQIVFTTSKNKKPIITKYEKILSVELGSAADQQLIKKHIIRWYQNQMLLKINSRVDFYSAAIGVKPTSIKIRNYKSRWGACSSKGALIFNWQIISFKPELFDYVVAHEVCHLVHMNHSPAFYKLLAELGFYKKEVHKQIRPLKNIF